MSRIPRLSPAQLDDAQRELYDAIAGGPRARTTAFRLTDDHGGLEGPFNAMLLCPPIGDAVQRLGAAIRYRGALSDRARELAILVVAAHWRSRFEWDSHERVARQVGLGDKEITPLRSGTYPDLEDPEEAAVVTVTQQVLSDRTLSETDYADATAVLGPAKLFELTTLIGYYELLALQMRIFGVD